MSSSERGRYIRRNVIDYIVILLAVLLLLSIGARFVAGKLNERGKTAAHATATFVLRGVENENAIYVSTLSSPFLFADNGTTLGQARFVEMRPTTVKVEEGDGSFTTLPSDTHCDLYFTLSVEGTLAKDGTFLLGGARRLSSNDHFTLSLGDGRYESEFLSVQIL